MAGLEVWTFLKDFALLGAAITGAVVAVRGLGTWQQQLTGQSEYDLSRRILVSLFKYRDAINAARHPAMWANEMPSPPTEEASKMKDAEIRHYGLSNGYQRRWDKVQEQRSSLYADLLEAEAIWGNELPDMFKNVYRLENELLGKIQNYLRMENPRTSSRTKEALEKINQKSREVMYDISGESPDEFKQDLLSAIGPIEVYLKPKLGHKKYSINMKGGAHKRKTPIEFLASTRWKK